ncbi:FAD-dependent oxidoreductase, partial [Morganella morganii]|uniref:FAD-dependent oxidoreductase n=1 Tax=Morganella morganii TaxID=582 RepID=UPI0015F64E30
ACRAAGIETQVMSPQEALRFEPSVNPALLGAVKVPDGTVDPFRLTAANMLDAREYGSPVLTYPEVADVLLQGDQVTGLQVYDHQYHRRYPLYPPVVVNSA